MNWQSRDQSAATDLGAGPGDPTARRRDLLAFFVLAVVIWPILAVAVVGGFGFIIWMSQLIFGPPGPPPV
jgi:nitrate reductase NapE